MKIQWTNPEMPVWWARLQIAGVILFVTGFALQLLSGMRRGTAGYEALVLALFGAGIVAQLPAGIWSIRKTFR